MHYIECHHDILADNLSRLYRLVTLAQITEGKSLVDPAVVSDSEEELYLLEQEHGLFDGSKLWEALEC